MFYIDTTRLFQKRDKLLLHILPTFVVFTVFFVLVLFSWTTAKDNVREEQQRGLNQRNTETIATIEQRMDAYEQILRGARGLFDASSDVNRAEWRDYLKSYRITERYPGIQGVGYATILSPDEVEAHVTAVRQEGIAEYTIRPAGDRALYSSIQYIEPLEGRNRNVLGYDMYSEPTRRIAMDRARDSGEPAMSAPVTPIQDSNGSVEQSGLLIYLAVYRTKSIPTTVAERRAQLLGYVYLPFRTYELINNTVAATDNSYGFRLFSLSGSDEKLMYESQTYATLSTATDRQVQLARIEASGGEWEIEGVVNTNVASKNVTERPGSVLAGGLLFCFLIAGFLYLLLGNRNRAFAEKEEQTIQAAKDELLALASHQLRTPATGVKQYVGMLREGFVGELTPTQKQLLDKAYESNERQLGTINEMLFVARSDAGHLEMKSETFDLSSMVQDIVDEQRGVIKQRGQKLTIKLPKRAIILNGDTQYIRMALENILSNATKYTCEDGEITVQLKKHGKSVLYIVTDTGVGVSKRHRQLLFKKFSRIPNELTNQVVGSGIGLYLAKQVIDAHNGTITFDSIEGKGSTVTVRIPLLGQATQTRRQ